MHQNNIKPGNKRWDSCKLIKQQYKLHL